MEGPERDRQTDHRGPGRCRDGEQGAQDAPPALRRRTAADRHSPFPAEQAKAHHRRRADRQPGQRDSRRNPAPADRNQQGGRHGRRDSDPQQDHFREVPGKGLRLQGREVQGEP